MSKIDLDKIVDVLGDDDDEDIPQKEFDDEIENSDIAGLTAVELEALLHELTARRLVEAMRHATPGAGMIQAARGFLRDNEVTGLDVPGTAVNALREQLKRQAPFPRMVKEG